MSCFCNSVSGTCHQGRRCPLRDTELANEEPLREQFATPLRTRADDQETRYRWAGAVVAGVAAMAVLAALLACWVPR